MDWNCGARTVAFKSCPSSFSICSRSTGFLLPNTGGPALLATRELQRCWPCSLTLRVAFNMFAASEPSESVVPAILDRDQLLEFPYQHHGARWRRTAAQIIVYRCSCLRRYATGITPSKKYIAGIEDIKTSVYVFPGLESRPLG